MAVSKIGALNPSWNGGRTIASGYVRVKAPAHPAADSRGYVSEHRLVMERSLGRWLCDDETVHHINGDKIDNRLKNLQLRRGRHGKGAVHMCGDCGSINIVSVALRELDATG